MPAPQWFAFFVVLTPAVYSVAGYLVFNSSGLFPGAKPVATAFVVFALTALAGFWNWWDLCVWPGPKYGSRGRPLTPRAFGGGVLHSLIVFLFVTGLVYFGVDLGKDQLRSTAQSGWDLYADEMNGTSGRKTPPPAPAPDSTWKDQKKTFAEALLAELPPEVNARLTQLPPLYAQARAKEVEDAINRGVWHVGESKEYVSQDKAKVLPVGQGMFDALPIEETELGTVPRYKLDKQGLLHEFFRGTEDRRQKWEKIEPLFQNKKVTAAAVLAAMGPDGQQDFVENDPVAAYALFALKPKAEPKPAPVQEAPETPAGQVAKFNNLPEERKAHLYRVAESLPFFVVFVVAVGYRVVSWPREQKATHRPQARAIAAGAGTGAGAGESEVKGSPDSSSAAPPGDSASNPKPADGKSP